MTLNSIHSWLEEEEEEDVDDDSLPVVAEAFVDALPAELAAEQQTDA